MFKHEKLAEFLKEQNISYRDFGLMVGITGAMVGHLVQGFKQPSAVVLKRIAVVMGCPMEDLID